MALATDMTSERIVAVMGTTAHVIVEGSNQLIDGAVARLHELEARWSRFRPDSEISRLNALPGLPVVVSNDTFGLVERAIAGWRLTNGLFDPTLLRELRDAGYDRSFELIGASSPAPNRPVAASVSSSPHGGRGDRLGVTIDAVVRSVTLQPGVEIDPGGIGKGLAADLVVEELLAAGARGAMVSIGGDLRAEGDAPGGEGWVVAVADPLDPDRGIATLVLDAGAVASTWRTKRAWTSDDGAARHHVLDPRTGRPAATGVAGVTVVAGRGWHAEVLAKAAFLAGSAAAGPLVRGANGAALVIDDDGTCRQLGDLAPFLSVTATEGART